MTDQITDPKPIPTNPLLARARIPGETFTLPSQGLFYHDGELDESVKNGEVYVSPMVTLDEIVMKSPDKLYSGEAFKDVFSRCIPQIKKPLKLLSKDIDYLLICLRKVSMGDFLEITYTHDCSEEAKNHTYKVSITPFIREAKRIDPTTLAKIYTVQLDNGQNVLLMPPRFDSVLKLYQKMGEDETEENVAQIQSEIRETLADMIQKVDDVSDKQFILEWLDAIKIGYMHEITKAIEKISDWGPTQTTKLICKDCGEEIEISTPLNPISFFT